MEFVDEDEGENIEGDDEDDASEKSYRWGGYVWYCVAAAICS